ncbi:MAG: hypothetical protein J6V73_02710 [Spirochaetaceae bacterium]|nr:hypothetical protein [Spirochaetaceae bacterium]
MTVLVHKSIIADYQQVLKAAALSRAGKGKGFRERENRASDEGVCPFPYAHIPSAAFSA